VPHPRVTIVMTARERHSLTVSAIESIIANTAMPFRFIYADGQAPDWLKRVLHQRAREWRLEFIEFGGIPWPNHIRNRIAPRIDTEYAVFLDNDICVAPGWLEALVTCADETGAGIVCPLYLIGADAQATKIHMAGGHLTRTQEAAAVLLTEEHRFAEAHWPAVSRQLRREACDFAEYHCVLMSAKLAKTPGLFDDKIVAVHEHIDAALTAKAHGYSVYFEPAAKVTYLASVPRLLSELEFFRSRWSPLAVSESIETFCKKWNVVDDARGIGEIRPWAATHLSHVEPLRLANKRPTALRRPMHVADLKQTLAGLCALAESRGYRKLEWDIVERAHRLAMVYANGIYRPCGRPFINRLAGTASVLMYYEFAASIVAAGLLHAAYTHAGEWMGDAPSRLAEICNALGGRERPLEKRVRAYSLRAERLKALAASRDIAATLTVSDMEVLAIEAANEVDLHLSGEFKFSGRRDTVSDTVIDLVAYVAASIGVTGLAETIKTEALALSLIPSHAGPDEIQSFRLSGRNRIPAGSGALCALLARERDQELGPPISTR
jgi:glycosyl transferase family 2